MSKVSHFHVGLLTLATLKLTNSGEVFKKSCTFARYVLGHTDILRKCFSPDLVENLHNFQTTMGSVVNTPPAFDVVVGGPRFISAPYQAGVEYDCFFIVASVQNVRQKLRKRLHTFVYSFI